MAHLTCVLASLFSLLFPAAQSVRLDQSGAIETRPLEGPLHHVQGIDVEGNTLWVSSVDAAARKGYLHRFDLSSGRLEARVEVQEGELIHPGGISLDGNVIWVPVAEYRRMGKSKVQRRDRRTLALLASYAVDDHIGCVAAGRGWIAGGNWDSLQIYFWTPAGRLIRKVDNPHGNRYQDMKTADGRLVASGKLASGGGAIDRLDPDSLRLEKRLEAGTTDRGVALTNEGMALRGGRLYLLPEDDPSRLFVFNIGSGSRLP